MLRTEGDQRATGERGSKPKAPAPSIVKMTGAGGWTCFEGWADGIGDQWRGGAGPGLRSRHGAGSLPFGANRSGSAQTFNGQSSQCALPGKTRCHGSTAALSQSHLGDYTESDRDRYCVSQVYSVEFMARSIQVVPDAVEAEIQDLPDFFISFSTCRLHEALFFAKREFYIR